MRVRKIGVGMVSLIVLTAVVQAVTIVNWGASDGDADIVTGNANGVYTGTYSAGYISPADGASGYDVNAAGQTREYYGAMDLAGGVFGIANNNAGDQVQMVKNFGGAGGTVASMIAWESHDFLAGDMELESLTMSYNTRGGTTTARWLIETAAGWYQSDQTLAGGWVETTDAVGDLTWSSYSLFGATGGAVAADTFNVVSVGAYFTSTIPTGINWTGAQVEYFKVTATGAMAGNRQPFAYPQSVAVYKNSFVAIPLTGSDPEGSNLTYSVDSLPTTGVLTGTAPNLIYTPNTDYEGVDSFTFTVNDGETNSAPATVSIDVALPVVVWNGYVNPVSSDQKINGEQAADEVWSTSTVMQPALGEENVSFLSAFSVYDDTSTVDDADYRALMKVEGNSAVADIWLRGGGNLVLNSYTTLMGFDTSAFDASLQLDAIAVEIREELGGDTTTFRWFVEAGGNAYVSADVDELTTTYTNITLDSATAIEWFAFDDAVNIGSAIGASQGTKTLQEMGFANLAYVGVYTYATFAAPAAWHGSRVKFFSATSGLGAGYASWAAGYGLSGDDALPGADVEPDGFDNLMEYALGGNPTIDDAAAISPETYTAGERGTNWFYHVYDERTDDASLIFEMGATPNLVTTAADTNDVEFVGATAETCGFKTVTNRTEAATAAKFIKLEVTQ